MFWTHLLRRTIGLSLCWVMIAPAQAEKVFVIGVEDQRYFPHYHYQDNDFSGYVRAVLDAFAAEEGIRFAYEPYMVDELFVKLIKKQIDFKYPDNPYWQFDIKSGKRISYSDAVTPYVDGSVVLVDKADMDMPALKRLGTIQGFTTLNYEHFIESGLIRLLEYPTIHSLLYALHQGEIDAAYANIDVLKYQNEAQFPNKSAVVKAKNLPSLTQSYRLSTTKHPMILKRFNQFLREKSELIEGIKSEYNIRAVGR